MQSVVAEDHCAVLERNEWGVTLILNSSVLSSTVFNDSKNNGECWCKMQLCSHGGACKENDCNGGNRGSSDEQRVSSCTGAGGK